LQEGRENANIDAGLGFIWRISVMISLRRLSHLARRLRQELRWGDTKFPPREDEFLCALRYINAGVLHEGNMGLFAYCIDHLPCDAPVVEIGSFAGLSLNYIIHLLRRSNRSNDVFSVDGWFGGLTERRFDKPEFLDRTPIRTADYRDHIVGSFRRNVELFSADRLPHHIATTSDEFFEQWRAEATVRDFFDRSVRLGGPISFAYIDGDHSYEQTMRDFENVDRHLVCGGFVLFDDSEDGGHWGSSAAAKTAAGRGDYLLVGKNPNYLIQKKSD
jgi:methyltransferase family protein